MQVTFNTQNYNNLQNNRKLQCCKPKPQSFTGSKEELVTTLTAKSRFFEPAEKHGMEWLTGWQKTLLQKQ